MTRSLRSLALLALAALPVRAQVPEEREARLDVKTEVTVSAPRELKDLAAAGEYGLAGLADAASEGVVDQARLEERPAGRPAEILESVPGLVITQHSGEGKANQYYLRGFDLDHGTDLATTVAGVPVNLPTHAHGQGYTDLNFLIPELVTAIRFRKGPYWADEGDFAAAGAVHIELARALPHGIARVEAGSFGFARALAADSARLFGGELLGAVEVERNDGPWARPDALRKWNGLARFSASGARAGLTVTAMAYDARWDATDQIPRRAVDAGRLSRFDAVDPTDGGRTRRLSLSAETWRGDEKAATRASAYVVSYGLNLWSDFTYFLDDPLHGDQFEQEDRRVVTGLSASHRFVSSLGPFAAESAFGLDARNDDVAALGLYATEARGRLGPRRLDHVTQTSGALWAEEAVTFSPLLRATAGLRGDLYRWNVSDLSPADSGGATRGILSPKLSVVLSPWERTDLYANAGGGFHSNDGRGATLAAGPVTPLVRAWGAEVGARNASLPGAELTAALWALDLDSELVFSGDAGGTEASRASRRYGVELGVLWRPLPGLVLDADLSLSRARFTGEAPEGNEIPGALRDVLTAGAGWERGRGPFGTLRVRYFGSRPLEESGAVRSRSSATVDLRAGWESAGRWRLALDALNLLDAKVSDVDYFYRSRLPGEPSAGVEDVHSHPAQPFSLRLAATLFF